MNFFVKYLLPGIAITVLVFETCNRSAGNKETKTGKAGDQFDLFAVMNTFQKSGSPESFEKAINSKSTGVNNLDLNEDGQTDYVKVIDKKIDDRSHVLVMQVDIDQNKTQDVATVEIEKTSENEAHIQIVGDKDLYGSDYIVEPKSDKAAAAFIVATTYAVNVWTWPAVEFIYAPAYVVWASPYYYDYYPVWWDPWPVVVYDTYYPTVSVYHVNYVMSDGYRFVNVHQKYYSDFRTTTKFNYHEKSYGNGENFKSNHDGDRDHDKNGFGNERNSGPGNSHGSDKHQQPGNDQKGDRHMNGGDRNDHKNGSQGNQRTAPDVKKNNPAPSPKNSPKQNGRSSSPQHSAPRSSQPKPGGAPHQGGGHGSGGHNGGAHGGGGHGGHH